MTPSALRKLERELTEFVGRMTQGMGRPERRSAMGQYITGLLLDGDRKSAQPMAARLVSDPSQADAMRQRLIECVSNSTWSDSELLRRLALEFERSMPQLEVFVVDDTGFPKKGVHSVGVHRQYSGTLGRTENCQVATSLHVAGERGSGCIGLRLYLPETWSEDRARCQRAGVPETIAFRKKWQIALDLLDQAQSWGLDSRTVLADSGYGEVVEFRDALLERGMDYIVGVPITRLIWPPGSQPQAPARVGGPGRPPTRWRDGAHQPLQIAQLLALIPRSSYRRVRWRSGSKGVLSSRFRFYRVHPAENHTKGRPPAPEHWLICEWRDSEASPRVYFSNLPASLSRKTLVRTLKLRWRVERDYQEMKEELGLDHFEGRTWRGFHHHATLCAVAHGFLALRRALFPPQDDPLDAPPGTPSAATDPDRTDRTLPAVPANRRRPRSALSASSSASQYLTM